MYKKKLAYSFFTIPVAVFSYNFYDWQRRRMVEKLKEIEIRKNRASDDPIDINSLYNPMSKDRFPWNGLNTKELNENFGFKPLELRGYFDHSRQIFVERVREGDEGYDIITPFYCYSNEKGELQPVLVNRGWIPHDLKENNEHMINATGPINIKGFVYKGDEGTKYSKENAITSSIWRIANAYDLATYMYLPNREISSQFIIRQFEYNPLNKSSLPVMLNIANLGNFPISAETNGKYAMFWKSFVFMNIFSNLMVWIYL